MNTYNFDVNFTTGRIYGPDLLLVVNDHNSTTFKFTFDQEGRYVFKLLYPDKTIYVQDIVDGELVLTKGILNQEGNYQFEISLYGDNNRLTTARIKEFPVRLELVETDEPVQADDRLPILDNLIEETNKVIEASKNGEFDGATFTPSVSEDGDLSWSNDKGKENPPTVNIKGPQGEPGAVKMQVVDTLPQVGRTDTIYLVPKDNPTEQNLYEEWIYILPQGWEHIGDTSVDLTDYYTKEETDEKLDKNKYTLPIASADTLGGIKIGDGLSVDEDGVITTADLPILNIYSDRNNLSPSFKYYDNTSYPVYNSVLEFLQKKKYQYFNIREWFTSYNPSSGVNPYHVDYICQWGGNTDIYSEGQHKLTWYAIPFATSNDIATTYVIVQYTVSDGVVSLDYVKLNSLTPNFATYTLTKTNTTAYTPTSNYHPATKKYVDDSVANASGGSSNYVVIDSSTSYDWNEVTQTLNSTENQSTLVSFMKDYIAGNNPSLGIKSVRTAPHDFASAPVYDYICNLYVYSSDNIDYTIQLHFEYIDTTSTTNKYGVGYTQIVCYTIEGSYNATSNTANISYYGYTSCYPLSSDAYRDNTVPLGISNSIEYSVTKDYQPAHKKYVDDLPKSYTGYDATKTQVLKNVNGTLTWITEE